MKNEEPLASQNPIEMCVSCGKETEYHFNDHVDLRTGYVEGAGQLCISCYRAENQETIKVPKSLITDTPNNSDLGASVRKIYWES
jgi:hypothetical protein